MVEFHKIIPKNSKFSYKHVEIKITPNGILCAFMNESFSKSLRIKRAEIIDENEPLLFLRLQMFYEIETFIAEVEW